MSESIQKLSSRITTFDLLRGYFMLSIVLNHLQWYPNGFDWLAMRGSLLVSAAEGFFLLSGIVLGIVRGRKLLDQPFRKAATLLLRRGVVLYVTSVILALLFTLIGWWFFMDNPGLKPGIRPIDQPFFDVLWGILSFKYIYGWADFLRLYAIFLLISPLALWLLRKNLWPLVLAGSIGVWLLYPIALGDQTNKAELLMVFSWQLIFFVGFIIGFYWNTLTTWWHARSRTVRRSIAVPILTVAALTLVADYTIMALSLAGLLPEPIHQWYTSLHPLSVKEALPVPRLLLFGLWFTLGYAVFRRYEAAIMRWAGWILLPFGQNSLYVYIVHAVLLFFAHLLLAPAQATNFWINLLGSLAIVGILYWAVRKRFLFSIIPR